MLGLTTFLFFLFNVILFYNSVKYHCFHWIFCVISSVTRFILVTLSSGYSAAALDEEYVSTYFLASSKEWFFSGFLYLASHSLFLYNPSVSVSTCSTLQIVVGCVDYKTGWLMLNELSHWISRLSVVSLWASVRRNYKHVFHFSFIFFSHTFSVLVGCSWYLPLPWFAVVLTLVLILRHSNEMRMHSRSLSWVETDFNKSLNTFAMKSLRKAWNKCGKRKTTLLAELNFL